MNKTWENGEKSNFVPDFSLFDPNFGPRFFFADFTSTGS